MQALSTVLTLLFAADAAYSAKPAATLDDDLLNAQAFYLELFKVMRENRKLCGNVSSPKYCFAIHYYSTYGHKYPMCDFHIEKKKLRLYLAMNQTVNFTACGFFSLGYPLVTSIIAAATTYLAILIQLST